MADQETVTLTRAQVEELRAIIHNADSPLGNRLQDVSARLYFALDGAGWTPAATPAAPSAGVTDEHIITAARIASRYPVSDEQIATYLPVWRAFIAALAQPAPVQVAAATPAIPKGDLSKVWQAADDVCEWLNYEVSEKSPGLLKSVATLNEEMLRAAIRASRAAPVQRGYLGSTVDGGIDDHDEDRPHQDDSGAAQDAGADAGATGAASGTGANQHHQHRAGQADDQRAGSKRNCAGVGLQGEDSIREAVAPSLRLTSMWDASLQKGIELCEKHGHAGDSATLQELHAALKAAPMQQDAPAPSMVGDAKGGA